MNLKKGTLKINKNFLLARFVDPLEKISIHFVIDNNGRCLMKRFHEISFCFGKIEDHKLSINDLGKRYRRGDDMIYHNGELISMGEKEW